MNITQSFLGPVSWNFNQIKLRHIHFCGLNFIAIAFKKVLKNTIWNFFTKSGCHLDREMHRMCQSCHQSAQLMLKGRAILWLHQPPPDRSDWPCWSGGSAAERVHWALNGMDEAGKSCLHIADNKWSLQAVSQCLVMPSQGAHYPLCEGKWLLYCTALCFPERIPWCWFTFLPSRHKTLHL